MLTEVTGDLFEVHGLDALAHGVNCAGVMGAGIAVEFKKRWPVMFRAYQWRCIEGMRLGDIFPWLQIVGPPRWIYNLATQPRPGPCATLPAVRESVTKMAESAKANGVGRIGMPRIGCGLGALSWTDVRPLIEAAAKDVEIVVVEWRKR